MSQLGASMSDPVWLSYAGALTGVVGAVTGISGAVMGYVAYRRSGELKALDLRLELRKSESELQRTVEELPARLEYAKKSHIAVASAIGMFGSGAFKRWDTDWQADLASVRSLPTELPPANFDYASASHSELEARLVAVHALRGKAAHIQEKYEAALAADDKEREHIRADHRVSK
jgi:hypothetical protein